MEGLPYYSNHLFPEDAHAQLTSLRRACNIVEISTNSTIGHPEHLQPITDQGDFTFEYGYLLNDCLEPEDSQSDGFQQLSNYHTAYYDADSLDDSSEKRSRLSFDPDAPPTLGSFSSLESDETPGPFEDAETTMQDARMGPSNELSGKGIGANQAMDVLQKPEIISDLRKAHVMVWETVNNIEKECEQAQVEIFVQGLKSLEKSTYTSSTSNSSVPDTSASLLFFGAGMDRQDLNETYSQATEMLESEWGYKLGSVVTAEHGSITTVLQSLLMDPVNGENSETGETDRRHEPRSFQFPLAGIDQEELDERRKVLMIKTNEEPPAILNSRQGLCTIPTGGLQLPKAKRVHEIDIEGLLFTPYKDFQDDDIVSLMQVSELSHGRLKGQTIDAGATGFDPGLMVDNYELWEGWSRVGNSSESIRSVSTRDYGLAKDTVQATLHGTKRPYQTYREDSIPSAQPSSIIQMVVTNTAINASSCSDLDGAPEVRRTLKGPAPVIAPESKTLAKKKPRVKFGIQCYIPSCEHKTARKTDLFRHCRESHEIVSYSCRNPHCQSLNHPNQRKVHATAREKRAKQHFQKCYGKTIQQENWLRGVRRSRGTGYRLLSQLSPDIRDAILRGFQEDID